MANTPLGIEIEKLRALNKKLYEALLSALGSLVALGIEDHSWSNEIMAGINKALADYETQEKK
jgi:hypothetical protein